MKKIITLITIVAIITSCKKDPEPQVSVVGKWNTTKQYSVEFKNGVENGKDTLIFDANHKLLFEFTSNNTGKVIEIENNLNDTSNFTYQVAGNNLTVNYQNGTSHATFSVNNNEMILNLVEEGIDGTDQYKWEDKLFLTKQ